MSELFISEPLVFDLRENFSLFFSFICLKKILFIYPYLSACFEKYDFCVCVFLGPKMKWLPPVMKHPYC